MVKKAPKPTSNLPTPYPEPDIAGAISALMALRGKPKRFSPEKIVTLCYEGIEVARHEGYSFTDIARTVKPFHLRISAKQLGEEYEKLKQAKAGVTADELMEL